jgi:hypothetical protein
VTFQGAGVVATRAHVPTTAVLHPISVGVVGVGPVVVVVTVLLSELAVLDRVPIAVVVGAAGRVAVPLKM